MPFIQFNSHVFSYFNRLIAICLCLPTIPTTMGTAFTICHDASNTKDAQSTIDSLSRSSNTISIKCDLMGFYCLTRDGLRMCLEANKQSHCAVGRLDKGGNSSDSVISFTWVTCCGVVISKYALSLTC